MKYLVVGSGLSGATFARVMHDAGHEVRVIEKRMNVGGNVRDGYGDDHTYIQHYGPHLFHTNSRKVVDFLSQFTGWTPYTHRVKAEVHGQLVDMPVNMRTIEQLYPPTEARRLQEALITRFGFNSKVSLLDLEKSNSDEIKAFAEFVKKNFVQNYSNKAWGQDVFNLDPAILKRIPVRMNYDDRYFEDSFQAQPQHGFTFMVSTMLHGIHVDVDTSFDIGMVNDYDRVYYTGPIDELCGYALGPLPYRSLWFQLSIKDVQDQDYAVVNHPGDMQATRTTNFGKIKPSRTGKAWFCRELPYAFNPENPADVPYYPVRSEGSQELYQRYEGLVDNSKFILAGRLGRFEYLNMDQAVAQALSLAEKELK